MSTFSHKRTEYIEINNEYVTEKDIRRYYSWKWLKMEMEMRMRMQTNRPSENKKRKLLKDKTNVIIVKENGSIRSRTLTRAATIQLHKYTNMWMVMLYGFTAKVTSFRFSRPDIFLLMTTELIYFMERMHMHNHSININLYRADGMPKTFAHRVMPRPTAQRYDQVLYVLTTFSDQYQ